MLRERTFESSDVTGAYVVGVPVGKGTLGRVVNAFGNPIIDGEDPLEDVALRLLRPLRLYITLAGGKRRRA
eukprot:9099043-Pyramimonas_sp.AAC.1